MRKNLNYNKNYILTNRKNLRELKKNLLNKEIRLKKKIVNFKKNQNYNKRVQI